jgi:CRISPR-associated protein Csd1
MILQTLHEYYWRKMADPDPARRLPAFGFEDKEIPFIVELAADGSLVGVKDTRSSEGKKKRAARYLVPKGVKKTSGIAANLLWDTAEYALGVDTRGKPERVGEQHAAFKARIGALPNDAQSDAGVRAVRAFLHAQPLDALSRDPLWGGILESNPVVTFRLANETDLVCQRPAVVHAAAVGDETLEAEKPTICLVTGELSSPERLHTAIKGVWGAQTSGANIVSFNLDAFNSFGKTQGANAPVSVSAAFAYTTALNYLLAKDSSRRVQVGDASTVFWAQGQDDVEDVFAQVFGELGDPDARGEQVKALYEAVHSGQFDGGRGESKFYVLGLAPNAARIAVRFWHAAPLKEIAARIALWFDDLALIRGPNDPEYPSLFRLLTAVSVLSKADNIPPNLGGDIMRSILSGGPFPSSWLNAAISRCRADQARKSDSGKPVPNVSYLRAAAIKAWLNRWIRFHQPTDKEFAVALDPDNKDPAYRLGRLFAAYERIQSDAAAERELNRSIRDAYFGAAMATPAAVFPRLMRLNQHHMRDLKRTKYGLHVVRDKLLSVIAWDISAPLPRTLNLPDQGRFAIGYYHQRQAFFTKNTDETTTVNEGI